MNKSNAPLVTVCIPFSRKTDGDWSISLASIVPPINATFQIRRTKNVKRDEAREYLAEKSIEDGSRFMLCLDDDVTVPPNIIRQLLFQFGNLPDDVGIVGGIYCTKTSPAMPLVFKNIGDGPFYKWHLGEVFECELLATGMMMVDLNKLKTLPKPWFKDIETVEEGKEYGLIPEDSETYRFGINDDGFLCNRFREAGYKIMAHGGCLGMHWDEEGTAFCLPLESYPMTTEYVKRWGTAKQSVEEVSKRSMKLIKEFHGYIDLLPIEQDTLLNVQSIKTKDKLQYS